MFKGGKTTLLNKEKLPPRQKSGTRESKLDKKAESQREVLAFSRRNSESQIR